MVPFRMKTDDATGERVYETSLAGRELLEHPLLNKGSAFTEEERRSFRLQGLLPAHVSTMEEQLTRTHGNYLKKGDDVERHIFLNSLHDRNETLFYRLLQEHVSEMMPIIYTPVVGAVSQYYSRLFRGPRGLYAAYPDRDNLGDLLDNTPLPGIEVVVMTDGERILGLGDLGVGGMGIPVGKLALYTLCAGIHPATTLPVMLDVGTDNAELLKDPLYLGWRHPRVRGAEYDAFVDAFVAVLLKKFPRVLLQWEDFAKDNATRLLEKYRDRLCTFNDDIQGTGAVTLAGLLAAAAVTRIPLRDHRIAILGAGSAATGIAEMIVAELVKDGVPEKDALANLWLIDSRGLVLAGRPKLEALKKRYAQPPDRVAGWKLTKPGAISLEDVVVNARPTALLGTSAQPGVFTEDIARAMAANAKRPIIFPLSNPTSKCEALPADILDWTDGRALVATGSPFADVTYGKRTIRIGQCNNAYIFPGMGLGILASGARRVTNDMFVAAARALIALSPAHRNPDAPLFPPLESIHEVSYQVALAVGAEAQNGGVAEKTSAEELARRTKVKMWTPDYARLERLPPNAF